MNQEICWYCDDNISTTTKLGHLICDRCDKEEIRTSSPLHLMNDEEKAFDLKLALGIFKYLRVRGKQDKESEKE